MSDQLHPIVQIEESTLETSLASLKKQQDTVKSRIFTESSRARELTSEIVGTRRAEDKQLLASDEAVSHALKDKMNEDYKVLSKLIDKPYFARIKLEEEINGDIKEIEYKIGFYANPDCRIIDWRKAPLSKLYYEYKEGDDYSEIIQGRERSGIITLRNRVDITKSRLNRISSSEGEFVKVNGNWIKDEKGSRSRVAGAYEKLPSVLSLITPDQFRAITEEAKTAILIQGVAGSGKTTVALHRLAWLLHEDNSDLKPEECTVLVRSPALKIYIQNSLPILEIHGVPVLSYAEWSSTILERVLAKPKRPQNPCPSSIQRCVRSLGVLHVLEDSLRKIEKPPTTEQDFREIVLSTLNLSDKIIEWDDTKLIDKDLIKKSSERFKQNSLDGTRDLVEDSLFLRIYEHFYINSKNPICKHLIVDEAQDFGAIELATIVGAVRKTQDLTLVGDSAQAIETGSTFPGWDTLMSRWQFGDEMTKYISLEISHRSTLPIMKLADFIQRRDTVKEGRPGRVPIWFKCGSESQGVENAIEWIQKALEKYPSSLTAVLCRDNEEVKFAYSVLKPTFGESCRIADENLFSLDEGVLIANVKDVKGLEFTNVVIWNPSRKNYDSEQERNLLYVAVTRAEENVCIITWQAYSKFLPQLNSPLVRGVDFTIE